MHQQRLQGPPSFSRFGSLEQFRRPVADPLPEYTATTRAVSAKVKKAIHELSETSCAEVGAENLPTVIAQILNLDGGLETFIVTKITRLTKLAFI